MRKIQIRSGCLSNGIFDIIIALLRVCELARVCWQLAMTQRVYPLSLLVFSQCASGQESAADTGLNRVGAAPIVLESISVTGISEASSSAQSGFNVDEIQVGEYQNFATDINQLMNSSPGIIIRESGGLGSSFNLSINGLSGNQVRYFVDGVPMENFGSALTLNNFPVNLIEGIEVYKGVTPISLSADALGGAINILTLPPGEEFLDASYTYGSFNTQRAALIGQTSFGDHFYLRLTSFYNDSDNDYWMSSVPRVDALGNKIGTMRARRFHDDYRSSMLSIKSGVINTEYIDELSLSLTYAKNKNNEQHPDTSINNVFGGFYSTNETMLASITYKKSFDKLNLKAYFLSGEIEDSNFDILSRNYDWSGNYVINTDISLGELDTRSIFDRIEKITRANIYGEYAINAQSAVALSLSINNLNRSGNDRINKNNTSFSAPNSVKRQVIAESFRFHTQSRKFHSSVFSKQYFYEAEINAEQFLKDGTLQNVRTLVDLDAVGYGLTAKYAISNTIDIKASYENAFRFPEPDEILGSGKYIRPNPNLIPEESQNLNLGIAYFLSQKGRRLSADVNAFYRNASNFIHFVADQVVFGKYENLDDVRIQGVESSASLLLKNRYLLNLNATWQDMTDRTRFDSDGEVNDNFGSKIPNEPYLFANFRAGLFLNNQSRNRTSIYWMINYVHKYFLKWENSGNPDDKFFIPSQLTHDFDIEYSMNHGEYNIAFSVRNIFDEAVFDNFDIQKPGRAYYLKLRYLY